MNPLFWINKICFFPVQVKCWYRWEWKTLEYSFDIEEVEQKGATVDLFTYLTLFVNTNHLFCLVKVLYFTLNHVARLGLTTQQCNLSLSNAFSYPSQECTQGPAGYICCFPDDVASHEAETEETCDLATQGTHKRVLI